MAIVNPQPNRTGPDHTTGTEGSESQVLLQVNDLKKHFPIKKGVLKRVVGHVKAVDGVSFYIRPGEALGLVGESGCGKSTTGRCITRLIQPSSGEVLFHLDGKVVDVCRAETEDLRKVRREIQIIFQDPFSSLDQRMSIHDVIAEPLAVNKIGTKAERTERVKYLLDKVGLSPHYMNRYPHEFSGGQRQRIGIARSLALEPKTLICDEPVSALDVSIQAQVLNLLDDLRSEFDLTYLFIAHDLSVVEHVSDRTMVMYLGKIVESGATDDVYNTPLHPYTEALLMAIPVGKPHSGPERLPLEGSVPDPAHPPAGCSFHTRCQYVQSVCREEEPTLVEVHDGRLAACHFANNLSLKGFKDRARGKGS
jgi:oligopeptide/dipeptide ABC transporter ATP-binding protein